VPDTELAAACGLTLENGIAVDATLASSDPAVFAAGDCCAFQHPSYGHRRVRLESWRSAQEHGSLAARNMLGHAEAMTAVPWFWSDQYDLTLQIAGLAEGATTHVRRELKDGAFVLFHLAPDGRLLAASGIGTGNVVAKDVRLAEMLIARHAAPDPAALADPAVNLKKLL
jgi:3-phenylpropionate/trans-cinnamate dioxygenase ferredoxin reductase subunit